MTKTTLFNLLLACSLIGNAVLIYAVTQSICVKTDPFPEALTISTDEAQRYYEEFKATLTSPDTTTGGVISTAAFEEMLCMDQCNGITYSFVRSNNNPDAPDNSGIFLVFEGVNITFDAEDKMVVKPIPGSLTYRSGNWCPPSCMIW
ncbi:MAG: hypothetical protein M3Q95_11070 [Bacteroidota bacterium]|nr:hypothetical protein [Bacteroidota bacterium]